MYRSHNCNELRQEHIGQEVTLSGWVHRRRDHGGLIFVDLRDREGLTQVVFDPQVDKSSWEIAETIRSEYVICISGKVRHRGEGMENPNLETGAIEIEATTLTILNKAKTPPFEIDQDKEVNEELRLKYRYLDIRKERMKNNIIMRHKIFQKIRECMDKKGFIDVETPILIKGTPEGSREYIVPSRIYNGKFYVLPQSPQQLKQLLMVGGIDKYYQIARCFRDEDQRGDRQPEFTQLDMEMSFVTQEDVMNVTEDILLEIVKDLYSHKKIQNEVFPKMTWQEAMDTYGSDKPDLRFDLPIVDLCEELNDSEFSVFSGAIKNGGIVRGLRVPGGGSFSRKEIDDLTEIAKVYGAKGLAYIIWPKGEDYKAPILKFIKEAEVQAIIDKTGFSEGDIIFFGAADFHTVCDSLGAVRKEMGTKMDLIDENMLSFLWVYNFPMFERDKESGQLASMHHPFTRPLDEDQDKLETETDTVLSAGYDIVCNGSEIGGGSLRIHERELQERIFKILNISEEDAERRFGHMLDAFAYGAPPHGGIAWGLDRLVMILQDEPNIREVIPFPKDQKAKDLMLGSPDVIEQSSMEEVGIELIEKE